MSVASFSIWRLARICFPAGALLFAASSAPEAIAAAGPDGDHPAIVAGVGHVVDGDTVDVGPTRVRLEGIDAPEISQTCTTASGESWDCGKAAAAMLRTLAENKQLACDQTGNDRYGRALAICFADGDDVNAAMVRAGLAWAFVRYSEAYVAVEVEARERKLGVWQGTAEAPWDYRRDRWQVAETTAPEGCAIKGNVSAHGRIYHMPWDPWYSKVKMGGSKGKRWFCSETEALAAGWRRASSN